MEFRRGVKRMTIFRFLLGRMVHGSGLDISAYLALFELYEWMVQNKDPQFLLVHKEKLKKTSKILSTIEKRPMVFPFSLDKIKEEDLAGTLVPTACAYFGQEKEKRISMSFRLILFSELGPQRLRPKRFVGRGYDDEGTYRVMSHDGSPSWQEVCVDWSNQGLYPEGEDTYDPLY